jgi:EAL and modified HD-GYP domain-containing signal transduction protein
MQALGHHSLPAGQIHSFLARQPVFDRRKKVYGYELLFRTSATINAAGCVEDSTATMQVLSNALMSIGAQRLLRGKKAFVNFNSQLLTANMHLTLPADYFVIEILETVTPNEDLLKTCRRLKDLGYWLALDDFVDAPDMEPMTDLANVIKVDVQQSSPREQDNMLRKYKPRGIIMLAEKVESHVEFDRARSAGYDLFQGYFFERPSIICGRQIPASHIACLRLLREMQRDDLNFQKLKELISADVSLTYRLLRYVNSSLFPRRGRLHTITDALASLGEDNLRVWTALATLPTLATNKPGELVILSMGRARFSETLALMADSGKHQDAFLMGMFSLLDTLIDQPLDKALRDIDLSEDIAAALLGSRSEDAFLSRLYRLIRAYERGCWDGVEELAVSCGIRIADIEQAYLDSTFWAAQVANCSDL